MDYEKVEAAEFGAGLHGLGLNILVRDVVANADFLVDVMGMKALRVSEDFAIMQYGDTLFQLHGDHTYHSHPLPSLISGDGIRGGGIELRLYDTDPDEAAKRAEDWGATILQKPEDKPHGLRECVILGPHGYAWVPSRPLA